MKRYFTDPGALATPWFEGPFFHQLIPYVVGDDWSVEKLCLDFHKNGYVKIDLELDESFIQAVITDMYRLSKNGKTQEAGYHYSDGPRIFEGWRDSQNILKLALNEKVTEVLSILYGREPIPFQTINFIKGSNQPLHSDTIHFHTIPERWMAGVWVALEDMTEANGPLVYVPGSHKLPCYTFQDLNLPVPEYGKQFDSYAEYERFIEAVVKAGGFKREKFVCKKGTALIWASNLLHGGSMILDENSTRLSQATHYYFKGCQHYYSPMFSDVANGVIAKKDLSTKDFYI
jgi:ectoine hydroxylase-related dioxygenase (phytanoyl-CoA dioxygenase family)